MSEETIYSIIDDIAVQAKVIIQQHMLAEALKQSAKGWDEAGEKMAKVFRDLEDDVREYFDKNSERLIKAASKGFKVGDDVYIIRDGMACKDKISDAIYFFDGGGMGKKEDEVFRSMTELVEYLKEHVNG